jgi:cell pole-organizing protein PopZ
MEEILASIRRIISDDEQNQAKKPAAAAVQPQKNQDDEGLELVEEADDQIISDIARVLSAGGANTNVQAASESAPAPVEAAMEEEDDILDLTAELGGLEPVEEPIEAEIVEMIELVAEAPADASEPEGSAEEAAFVEAPAPEMFQPAPARPKLVEAVAPPPLPEPAPAVFTPPPPPMSASDEAASALERAIAALRAGQLPTSFTDFTPAPPVFETAPEPVAAPEPAAIAEPEPESAEPDLVLTDFESEVIIEETVIAAEPVEPEPAEAPAWEAEAPSFAAAVEREAAYQAPRSNGRHDYSAAAPQSLEDSIKDMLRPMLRQWLDENMARVLTSALQDELRDNPARFQRD